MKAFPGIAVLIFCILLSSCASKNAGQNNNSSGVAVADTPSKKDTVFKQVKETVASQPTETDSSEMTPLPGKINRASFSRKDIKLGKHFTCLAALKKLFPGKYYHISNDVDTLDMEVWKCGDCGQRSYTGWFGESPDPFPFDSGNITRYVDSLLYTDDEGHRNVIVSFSSTFLQSLDCLHCGRTECVILGLALFSEEEDGWQLKSFSPSLGCFGAFQYLPAIHLIAYGKDNYGCYLTSSNGGGGSYYTTAVYVFGLVNGTFRQVLDEPLVARSNTGISEWDMKLRNDTAGSGFGDMYMTIAGNFNKRSFDEWEEPVSEVPAEIMKKAATRDSFDFTISRQYRFNGTAYKLLHSSVGKKNKASMK